MTAAEYWDLCNQHDWFYNFADSHARWRRGEDQRTKLLRLAAEQPDFREIFDAFQDHKFSGVIDGCGSAQTPKPERPKVHTFGDDVPTVHPDQLRLI